jgi:GNAT superfamily N-acetyltransferase
VPDENLDAAAAEAVEAEARFQSLVNTPAETLGAAAARIGGGVVLSMRGSTTSFVNRALGFTTPITGRLIDEILDFYRSQRTPAAAIQLPPAMLPADWAEICASRGLKAGESVIKLACRVDDAATGESSRPLADGLRIAPVDRGDAERWGTAMVEWFGVPDPGLAAMMTAGAGHPRFRPYAVWKPRPDGPDRMVAGGNVFVDGEVAELSGAATEPAFRGRGAQTALIAVRIDAARKAGARWVATEVGRPPPGHGGTSLDNMLRAGLRVLYVRQNWRWANSR